MRSGSGPLEGLSSGRHIDGRRRIHEARAEHLYQPSTRSFTAFTRDRFLPLLSINYPSISSIRWPFNKPDE